MKKAATLRLLAALLAVLGLATALLLLAPKSESEESAELTFTITSGGEETLQLIKGDGKSNYTIIFSSDAIQLDYTLAAGI